MSKIIEYNLDFIAPPKPKLGTPQTAKALKKKRGPQRYWRLPPFKYEGEYYTAMVTLEGDTPVISFRKWRSRKKVTMSLGEAYQGAVLNQLAFRL